MIEIFTRASGTSGKAERSLGDSLNLRSPSDVFLGSGSPGIAFYEKAGADLRVTLLDGKVVSLQNFFAMGPNGEYSRLLNGEAGAPEVTGLIAPEPFVPRDDTPALTTAPSFEAEPAPQPISQPATPEAREPVASTYGGESLAAPEGGAPAEAAPAGDAAFFGVPADLLGFAAANLGLLWLGLSESDEAPTVAPAPGDAPGGETGDSALTDPAPSSDPALVDPEVLALLTGAAAGDDLLDLSFGATAPARGADFGTEGGAVPAEADFDALYSAEASGFAPYDELFQPIPAI